LPFDPFADFDSRGYLRNHFGFKDVAKVKIDLKPPQKSPSAKPELISHNRRKSSGQ